MRQSLFLPSHSLRESSPRGGALKDLTIGNSFHRSLSLAVPLPQRWRFQGINALSRIKGFCFSACLFLYLLHRGRWRARLRARRKEFSGGKLLQASPLGRGGLPRSGKTERVKTAVIAIALSLASRELPPRGSLEASETPSTARFRSRSGCLQPFPSRGRFQVRSHWKE